MSVYCAPLCPFSSLVATRYGMGFQPRIFEVILILRAPQSLPQAIEEAATGNGAGWPRVQATPEAFFERCQTLHWRFFATLYDAFVAQVLPQATPGYAAPLHPLRERFPEVWIVDGARLDAVAHRLELLREVRARGPARLCDGLYDLYRGMTRHLDFNLDAAAGDLLRATAALAHVPKAPCWSGIACTGWGRSLRP